MSFFLLKADCTSKYVTLAYLYHDVRILTDELWPPCQIHVASGAMA